jgi:hypothetical protein
MTSAYVSTQYGLINRFVLKRHTGQHSERMCTDNKTVKDSIFSDLPTTEDKTTKLSRNVGNQLPMSVAYHPRRTDFRSLQVYRIVKTEYHGIISVWTPPSSAVKTRLIIKDTSFRGTYATCPPPKRSVPAF